MARLGKDDLRGEERERTPSRRQVLHRRYKLAALWAFLLLVAILAYFALTLPPTSDLTASERRPSVTMVTEDGTLIATFGDLFGQPVHLKDLPRYVPQAVIATEDRRFYHHYGVDPLGLMRAAFVNLRAGHVVQGGSTITQQLAKNLFLTPERTIPRKIRETMLALWLEHKFTKDQILELYLNRVYLGAGTYGVDAAAERYFDKPAKDLTLYEAAVIAGLLKAPTRFSPANDQDRAAVRADQVLANMVEEGYITPAQARAASQQKDQLGQTAKARPGSRYFADWIAEQIPGFADVDGRDIVVTTTLDPRMQSLAEKAVDATLDASGKKYNVSQGALVALSPDGAVRAMVGGRSYGDSQFNRATQALRQPGSSFKPFVYLAALEHGLQPSDVFNDAPITIGDYTPHNYENSYRGNVTVSDAVAYSINTVAVQVLQQAGIDNVIAAAQRLGITSDLPRDASLALGTGSVTLMEMTSAYAAFASGGTAAWPHGIIEIRDAHGGVLYQREGSGAPVVIDPGIDATMNQLLTGVIDYGTGRAASIGRPAAGKTGTTQDFRDALFIGYTADLVAGVWFGNDDNTPMKHVTGGMLPAQTWHNFMAAAVQGMPIRPLPTSGPVLANTPPQPLGAPPQTLQPPSQQPIQLLPPPGPGGETAAPPQPSGNSSPGVLQGLLNSIFGPPLPTHRPPGQ
jgi:penicillin-binding protein 1A